MTCPRCNGEGPFEKVPQLDSHGGAFRILLCPACHLSWRVYG